MTASDYMGRQWPGVLATQRQQPLDVVRAHLAAASTARKAGDRAGAARSLTRAGLERNIASTVRARSRRDFG